MSSPLYPVRQLPKQSPIMDWIDRLALVAIVIGLGILLGLQYMEPDKRVLAVAAATIVIGVAWRLDMVSAIGVLILALPYPRGTTFGSTNLALILLLLVIYLLRVTQREAPAPSKAPTDAPVGAFFLMVVLSFYNIPNATHLYFALQNFQLFVGTLLVFWLVVNNIKSEADLQRLHSFQTVVILSICLVACWELNHPGGALVPGWIEFTATHGTEFDTKNLRVGATFYDYELLADFCGLNLLFLTFLFIRAEGAYRRMWFGFLAGLSLFVMFACVTRGPLVSLSVALSYMTFLMRRHVKLVPLVIVVSIIAGAFFGMNYYVAHFTRSGDLFARAEHTQMVGWMPDSRAGAWTDAWTRAWEHPLIGHGPYYSAARGLKLWYWPHNLYLYVANAVGFIGLGVFFWFMATLWKLTKPTVDHFRGGRYVDAYLFIAHVQVLYFLVDQFKIEYWRNPTYQFQVWLMFAFWVGAYKVSKLPPAEARLAPRAA
jgi:hypothetical protein